ncbi:hypothetical protein [Yoonia litorea]|uniref:Uncharacterized protein n=1 Tax=Yoonia litorea TaxID=1123755 RepID=A0A1I6L8G1_9RHOB|nr:hypothetical protein [Yoonia litorea]SFR99771.1 hypothetical protein SAMN05444714_0289 [Yoonia litorea]
MLFRLPGAFVRAALVVMLIIMPHALLPGRSGDSAQIVALAAVFAALFTIVEYISTSPSLVEFRDAPPFNRVRFSALFATVLCLSVIFRGAEDPTAVSDFFQLSGSALGVAIDFPYSPLRLMLDQMPASVSEDTLVRVRDAAGLIYLIASVSVIYFIVLLRFYRWPRRNEAFNVWINLPTFDPTSGGDVIKRLRRDARFNILLGIAVPFLIPTVIWIIGAVGTSINLQSTQTLIWVLAAWAFIPANLLMRGVAISRIAYMIELQRRRAYGDRDVGVPRYS